MPWCPFRVGVVLRVRDPVILSKRPPSSYDTSTDPRRFSGSSRELGFFLFATLVPPLDFLQCIPESSPPPLRNLFEMTKRGPLAAIICSRVTPFRPRALRFSNCTTVVPLLCIRRPVRFTLDLLVPSFLPVSPPFAFLAATHGTSPRFPTKATSSPDHKFPSGSVGPP